MGADRIPYLVPRTLGLGPLPHSPPDFMVKDSPGFPRPQAVKDYLTGYSSLFWFVAELC